MGRRAQRVRWGLERQAGHCSVGAALLPGEMHSGVTRCELGFPVHVGTQGGLSHPPGPPSLRLSLPHTCLFSPGGGCGGLCRKQTEPAPTSFHAPAKKPPNDRGSGLPGMVGLMSHDCKCIFSTIHPLPKQTHFTLNTPAGKAGATSLALHAEQPKQVKLGEYSFGSISSFQHSGDECGKQARKKQ